MKEVFRYWKLCPKWSNIFDTILIYLTSGVNRIFQLLTCIHHSENIVWHIKYQDKHAAIQDDNHSSELLYFPLLATFWKFFYIGCNSYGLIVSVRVKKAALDFIYDQNHVLNSCYEADRNFYRMPRTGTNRFLESFIPFSIQLLNKCYVLWWMFSMHCA